MQGTAAVKIGCGAHEGLSRRNSGAAGHTARGREAGGDIHDGSHGYGRSMWRWGKMQTMGKPGARVVDKSHKLRWSGAHLSRDTNMSGPAAVR